MVNVNVTAIVLYAMPEPSKTSLSLLAHANFPGKFTCFLCQFAVFAADNLPVFLNPDQLPRLTVRVKLFLVPQLPHEPLAGGHVLQCSRLKLQCMVIMCTFSSVLPLDS